MMKPLTTLLLITLLYGFTPRAGAVSEGEDEKLNMSDMTAALSVIMKTDYSEDCNVVNIGTMFDHDLLPMFQVSADDDLTHLEEISNEFNYLTSRKCWIALVDGYSENNKRMILKFVHLLKSLPQFILVTTNTVVVEDLYLEYPVTFVNLVNSKFIYIRCNGCEQVHRGYWDFKKSSLSRNLDRYKDSGICCHPLHGKQLRVSYTTFPPYFKMTDEKDISTLDRTALEYYYLSLFLEKNRMKVKFLDANFKWGSWVNDTNTWNGVVGMVGYNKSDLGISSMGYSAIRNTHVDYTHHLLPMHFRWISKAPGKIAPYQNLIMCFNPEVWAVFIASVVAITLALYLIVRVGQGYGVQQYDIVYVLLQPLGMMNAEEMPNFFEKSRRKGTLIGFSGNFLLLHWSIMGMVVMFSFTCNLRALLMRAQYDKPIDTMEDVVKSGLNIQVAKASWIQGFLSTSGGYWERVASENLNEYNNDKLIDIELKVAQEGKDISYRTTIDFYGRYTSGDPRYDNLPLVHFSKSIIRPYYTGWVVQKFSQFHDPVNMHILNIHKGGLINKPVNSILSKAKLKTTSDSSDDSLEPLSVSHMIGMFVIYFIGLSFSVVIYAYEIFKGFLYKGEEVDLSLKEQIISLVTAACLVTLITVVIMVLFIYY